MNVRKKRAETCRAEGLRSEGSSSVHMCSSAYGAQVKLAVLQCTNLRSELNGGKASGRRRIRVSLRLCSCIMATPGETGYVFSCDCSLHRSKADEVYSNATASVSIFVASSDCISNI